MTAVVSPVRNFAIRQYLRPALITGLTAILALALFETMIAPIIHRQRQEHLVSDFLARRPSIGVGDALAVLQIPSIELNSIVAEGDSRDVLRGGPGHVPRTPAPGEPGNSVIVGKSARYASPFERLGKLTEGESIFVQVRGGATNEYLVQQIVHLRDGESLPTGDGPSQLTLVTSEGGLFSGASLVVVATPTSTSTGETSQAQEPVTIESPRRLQEVLAVPIWIAVSAALVVLARRMRLVVSLIPTVVAVGPMLAYVGLRLLLASDIAFSATH